MTDHQSRLDRPAAIRRRRWPLTAVAIGLATLAASAATATPPEPPRDPGEAARAFERRVLDAQPVPGPPIERLGQTDIIDFGRGPVTVHVPDGYDPASPAPLIILLHGYMNTGQDVENWLRFTDFVDELGFLYLYPTGTSDFLGNPFWNATDACCNLFGSGVDDSAYLRGIVDTMQATYAVDPDRIHFAGHSNGGFMAHRMACDHADVVASIMSLAGATFLDPADCQPSQPVNILQVHGTADGVISYGGGCIPFSGCYPSATETALQWADFGGCDSTPVAGGVIDLVANQAGAETQIERWEAGCAPGGSAELWTIPGGVHSPAFTTAGRRAFVEYLLAHGRGTPCPGDVDEDGTVGVGDLLAVLAAWGTCSGCPADIDGDGTVATGDLLAVLAGWGACE